MSCGDGCEFRPKVDNRSLPAKSADELRYAELWRESLAWKSYSPAEMLAAKERERKQKEDSNGC